MFDRFTLQAREVVVRAQECSRELGHDHIGTEHLLLGVVDVGGDVPTAALSAAGLDEENVRARVIDLVGVGDRRPDGFLPFTPRAKRSLESAMDESVALGHSEVGTGHLLLGVLSDDTGVAHRVLVDLNVPLDQLRAALLTGLQGHWNEQVSNLARGSRESSREEKADHRGPPDNYVVTRPVAPSDVSEDVRSMAEQALSRVGVAFDDVAFVAEVRDADPTAPSESPEWLVAVHGPSPRPGMIVRTVGSWASGAHMFSSAGTHLRVGTVERVELSPDQSTSAGHGTAQ